MPAWTRSRGSGRRRCGGCPSPRRSRAASSAGPPHMSGPGRWPRVPRSVPDWRGSPSRRKCSHQLDIEQPDEAEDGASVSATPAVGTRPEALENAVCRAALSLARGRAGGHRARCVPHGNPAGRTRCGQAHHDDPQRARHGQMEILLSGRGAGSRDDRPERRRPGEQRQRSDGERPASPAR